MTRPLEGRAAIITGASHGLGEGIARAYLDAGASVVICGRDQAALDRVRESLERKAGKNQMILSMIADVSREEDVQRLADAAFRQFSAIQILVNNAGVYGPKGFIDEIDWQEWVRAIQINLMGSVMMCRAVLPHFKRARYGKIIQLSGGGATNPLPRISAYAASKAAIVRFAETLAEEVRDLGIDVNSIAPGALNTRLLDEVLEAGPGKVGAAFYARALKQKTEGGTPLDKGEQLAVFLASPASDGITGKLLSAIWDPWPQLPDHREDLSKSDVYTLRRIVPKDRGFGWGEP